MLYDITTIAIKEFKEILVQRGSTRGGITGALIAVAILGIFLPFQAGADWVESPQGLSVVAVLPLFLSTGVVVDSFAGERERHTLETLLASRLSDRAILFGKLAASVGYSFSLAFLSMFLGIIVANIQAPGIGFYPIPWLLSALLFSLLGSLLVSGIGVLVSLRAETVRQAYQQMSLGYWILLLPLLIGPRVLPPEWQAQIAAWAMSLNIAQVLVVVGAAILLLIVNALLILAALARFQRARLIS